MLRIPRIFLNGSAAISRRVSSLRWAVASPNFDAPDHGILFLRIGPELRL
jgi:hypothetical protein